MISYLISIIKTPRQKRLYLKVRLSTGLKAYCMTKGKRKRSRIRNKSGTLSRIFYPAKSGNGTIATQDLYLLVNIPFIWIVKIGISGDGKKRARDIDKSAIGIDVLVCKLRFPFAYHTEQLIHSACRLFSLHKLLFVPRSWFGSGKTERFFFLAVIFYFLFALPVWIIYHMFVLLFLFSIGCFLYFYLIDGTIPEPVQEKINQVQNFKLYEKEKADQDKPWRLPKDIGINRSHRGPDN